MLTPGRQISLKGMDRLSAPARLALLRRTASLPRPVTRLKPERALEQRMSL